ncbi:hypothetical protein BGX28_010347, partial [Mortierella sp. GBA30]
MQGRSTEAKYTCKTVMNKIKKLLAQTFVFTAVEKDNFCDGLGSHAPLQLRVCHCATEADICIARSMRDEQLPVERVIVSGDSDFLGYLSNDRVLRSVPKSNNFAWYTKTDIKRTLELPSDQHLLLLAIVTRNDYGRNVDTLGIVTNCRLIRDIPVGTIDNMLQSYVAAATAEV